jgi:DNA-binding beta-propeller fold protein YncE
MLAITPDGAFVYVPNQVDQTVSVISTESYRVHERANSLRGYAHGTTESIFI